MSDPECALGPCEPRVTAATGRRDAVQHPTGFGIDLLDAGLGKLKQVLPVESRPGMRSDIDRVRQRPAAGVEGVQLPAGGKPDIAAVVGNAIDALDTRKGPVLTDDLGF